MSTGVMPADSVIDRGQSSTSVPYMILKALGSLKITVAMFALGILVILFGTLAQDEMDLATVKREFFVCWIASVPFDVLFPVTLIPHESPYLGGLGFYFPGGATVGLVLLINLIAAKATRFRVSASGTRLALGILVSLLGAGLVLMVILSGHTADGLQGKPYLSYDALWGFLKGGICVMTLGAIAYAIVGKMPAMARIAVAVYAAMSLGLSVLLLAGGESVRLDDPGLRIVWQLLQASVASCVALVGLWIVFGKRGGNVLIHVGVGLLMVGQFVFGDRQIEQRMGMAEGESTNLAVIEDEIEIVLIDTSNPDEDIVYALPESLIRSNAGSDRIIDDPELPCKVRIDQWMKNSELQTASESEIENKATAGIGKRLVAKEAKPVGGAITNKINIAAAYVTLLDKDSGEPIETLLLSQQINDIAQISAARQQDRYESVELGGKPFDLGIRYRQLRKPYDVFLKDVSRRDYSGTDTPRDYSSLIVITDRESGKQQEDKTWMNNPIRYQGETFYQSRYNKVPLDSGQVLETTGLQVVKNSGWVIPYVCCMMVFWGMFAHFGNTFVVFANRFSRGAILKEGIAAPASSWGLRIGMAAAGLGTCLLLAGYFAKPKSYSRNEIDWNAINQLPVQHEGRIKPFDTVARNVLQRISKPIFGQMPSVKDAEGNKHLPSEWLLGVMAGQEWVKDAQVFRVYAPEVRSFFELEKRKRYRYSYNELEPHLEEFRAEIAPLRGEDPDTFSFRDQKMVELHGQLNLYDLISFSYREPPLPSPAGIETEEDRERFFNQLMGVFNMMQNLESGGPPAVIPPMGDVSKESLVEAKWQAFGPARFASVLAPLMGLERETNPAVAAWSDVVAAAAENKPADVNQAVRKYQEILEETPLAAVTRPQAEAESWLNKFDATAQGVVLYLLVIILGFAGFMVRRESLRKYTFWLLVGVFCIHTIAILARIYITGRAPVINLYSSAVFIGWACVLLGLVLEVIYPIGIANLASGLIGVCTLSVARFLDTSDTMPVLQAVLDTQFWLSTHVITVTAGYSVTFLAGFLGICALTHRMTTGYDRLEPSERPAEAVETQKILYRMTYGVICFAIFFSFIGTVLGGLWADDSWGRFWGWDPKENGALMIVLWNAILLHARWDKQVGERGFAALAVLGNVVTAWSWFGTNQLGIGLHSYGFTSGALIGLVSFVGVNVAFVLAGLGITGAAARARENSKVA